MNLVIWFPETFIKVTFRSDVSPQAGAAGLRGRGRHGRGRLRGSGVLWLPGHPHLQQQHEGQSSCADADSGDGQTPHGQQLLWAHHAG